MSIDAGAVVDWFAAHARDLPWRRPGFGAWGVLLSELMLQQTQVSRVAPVIDAWLERWPTPSALAATPPAEVLRAWGRLGYPRRALALHAAATAIALRHGDRVPDDVDALLALPGVGAYTARAVAVFAHGRRHPVVDTNVRRVIARAQDGLAVAPPPSERRDLAAMEALLPPGDAAQRAFNAGVMELGAVVCTARAPQCEACPIVAGCAWRAAGYPPATAARRRAAPFAGSDRERRGRVMALLRDATAPVPDAALTEALPDREARDRVLAGLAADGLAEQRDGGWSLPG